MMIEHRLIERMIALMEQEIQSAETSKRVDPRFIDTAAQFIRTYADRCHHGKEEDILFRELRKKPLSDEHARILDELVEEHQWGRETTAALVDANERYASGDSGALSEILDGTSRLVTFYPKHIEKEDKHFFLPAMKYFSEDEKQAMLKEGHEFDSTLMHREYADMISGLEKDMRAEDVLSAEK
jgi:hemerythrin-like domain-containing protein